jgi:hypothetical protein
MKYASKFDEGVYGHELSISLTKSSDEKALTNQTERNRRFNGQPYDQGMSVSLVVSPRNKINQNSRAFNEHAYGQGVSILLPYHFQKTPNDSEKFRGEENDETKLKFLTRTEVK